jgi:hypothetical protein
MMDWIQHFATEHYIYEQACCHFLGQESNTMGWLWLNRLARLQVIVGPIVRLAYIKF